MLRYLHLVMFTNLFSGANSDCSPAEEGKLYIFQGTFNHTLSEKLELLWKRNETSVSSCRSNLRCNDDDIKRTITSLSSVNNYEYNFRLSIPSFTRNDSKVWLLKYLSDASLIYSKPLFECDLKIFAKGVNASCQQTMQKEIVKVHCQIFDIYPAAKSILFVKAFNESSFTSEILMDCKHNLTMKNQTIYFTSVCEVNIPIKQLRHWHGGFVTMYPNITGDRDDRKFGVNITLNKFTDKSVLTLENCPQVVVEGSEVRCLCRTKHSAATTDNNHAWYDFDNKMYMSGKHVLAYVATRRNGGYVCRERNIVGVNYNTVVYKPLVIYNLDKDDSLKCATHKDDMNTEITCNVSKIYPEGICQATVESINMKIVNDNVQATTKNIYSPSEIHYSTQCKLNLSNNNFLHDNYLVSVIVYPNVTGYVSDKMYGVNQTVNVNFYRKLSATAQLLEAGKDVESLIGPITLGAVALIFVVIMVSLLICYRKKIFVFNVLSQVFIIGNRNKIRISSRNISPVYESVEDITVTSDTQLQKTYANSEVIAKELACRLQLLDKDYITPSEIRITYQKTNHSDTYI